jgi:hypothetical protein
MGALLSFLAAPAAIFTAWMLGIKPVTSEVDLLEKSSTN